ncbi:MAG: glucose-6-phosphate isomerase family protein [Patescibacteria group bacterium]|nr:glucose-6-phosphate isomerase family protein [Patescibacteria group bacterium]
MLKQKGAGNENSKLKKPQIRFLADMRSVLYDQKWLKTASNFEVYYIYRGVKKKNGLRYDITVIPPKMLGKEFVKTKGHYHIGDYQEIYEVLRGQAIFLLQKGKDKIKDVYAIEAKKGDIVIIPSHYGHITINPTGQTLKMANWISEKCKSIYELFEKKQGACYYYTQSGWIKNKNYGKIPKLRFERPLKSKPKNLNFLK